MKKFSTIARLVCMATVLICFTSPLWAQTPDPFTPPPGLTQAQWRVVRPYWTWRTRTVQVFHQDGTLSTGLFLGLYDNSIAILKDANHPIRRADQTVVLEIPQSEVASITIDQAWKPLYFTLALYGASQFMYGAITNSSMDIGGVLFLFPFAQLSMGAIAAGSWGLYSLAPPFRYISIGLTQTENWAEVRAQLSRYTLVQHPADLYQIAEAAPLVPDAVQAWASLYPVFPTLQKAMQVQPKWSLAFSTGGGLLSVGYPQAYTSVFDSFAGEDYDPFRSFLALQAHLRYQLNPRWAIETNFHSWGSYDVSKNLAVDQDILNEYLEIDEFFYYGLRTERYSFYAMADLGLLTFDEPDKKPFNLSVGAGPGVEALSVTTVDFSGNDGIVYRNRGRFSAGVRGYLNAEWVVTNRFRPFVRVVGNWAMPVLVPGTPLNESPDDVLVWPDVTIPLSNVGLYFGIRTSLDNLKR